jgi:hypothetical protein
MTTRRPTPARLSNPIPPLAQLASTLALGALAGVAACKTEEPRADTLSPPPPDASLSATDAALAPLDDAASTDASDEGGFVPADASMDSPLAIESTDSGACIGDAAACTKRSTTSILTLTGKGDPFLELHGIGGITGFHASNAGGLAMRPMSTTGMNPTIGSGGANAPPFDTNAAQSALTTAAGGLAACKQPGGPTGHGHVSVVFGANGRPTKIVIGPPFQATGVGSCIEGRLRRAHVPPFSGPGVTLYKGIDVE